MLDFYEDMDVSIGVTIDHLVLGSGNNKGRLYLDELAPGDGVNRSDVPDKFTEVVALIIDEWPKECPEYVAEYESSICTDKDEDIVPFDPSVFEGAPEEVLDRLPDDPRAVVRPDDKQFRDDLTLRNAREMYDRYEQGDYPFRLMIAVQGWDTETYVNANERVLDMGHRYVGIESDAVGDLLEASLLRHDTDHPHRLYSVTSDGRHIIGEGHRQGLDYGDGKGDFGESTMHVFGVEVARRWLEQEYADDSDSPVTTVETYYEVDGQERLDLVGLDPAGGIHVTVEVERINHDVRGAVPADYDKMAACDPDKAIWIVMKQHDGHAVLDALNDPLEGPPRVEKTYAKTTPPQQFRIDSPGCTAIYPVDWVRAQL